LKYRFATLLKVFAVLAAVVAAIAFYRNSFQKHRTGVSPSVANRMIWEGYRLPKDATDVTYYSDFGGCEAEFAIPEADFLKWCEQKGWTAKRITKPIPYFQSVLLSDDASLVVNGYHLSIPDGECVYDSDCSRAAFWVSTFP
jgi:hypothetical protein